MDAAAQHENRHRAVIEYANGAMFNVAELDAWAISSKVPVSFETLLKDELVAENYRADRHFVHYSILSVTLASRLVPEGMEPSDASVQLMAAGDIENHADPVRRLRDLVMVRYDRQLLNAVYDGDLFLYDSLTMSRLDVTAGKLRWQAEAESRVRPVRKTAPATTALGAEFPEAELDAFTSQERFTLYEAAMLAYGKNPGFFDDIQGGLKTFKDARAIFYEMKRAVESDTLPAHREYKTDGTLDDERSTVSRVDFESWRTGYGRGALPLPGTAEASAVVWAVLHSGAGGSVRPLVPGASASETPEQRQVRRLARFRALGGNLEKVGGNQWRLAGRRGALADLSREEKTAGHARHDARDVRRELDRAASSEIRE
ncbi:hypothetical protein [Ralstonia pseudosolanacearum]|uniref:Uncharacterized protein n=1 Tax=Ralstonia solanacearum TaxID=305 RepID=A0AA92EG27_RALSL|nr:hypothetical protein [Ralstonia pseudosolanacearum]QCX50691.1 hypothetical protein E7Z57_17205 [Ralstonia pseudosolanacearum]